MRLLEQTDLKYTSHTPTNSFNKNEQVCTSTKPGATAMAVWTVRSNHKLVNPTYMYREAL